MDKIKGELECPICKTVPRSPVCCQDQQIYCYQCIESWFKNHDFSPFTGEKIDKKVYPNKRLENIIKILTDNKIIVEEDLSVEYIDFDKMVINKNFSELLKHKDIVITEYQSLFQNCSDMDIIKHVIDNMVDINIKDKDGFTPLHIACHFNSEVVPLLLGKPEIDINVKENYDWTPLHIACRYQPKAVKYLLEKPEIDINVWDDYGFTQLHVACKFQPEAVKLLLEKPEIDINVKDIDGCIPLHIACMFKTEVVKLILEKSEIDINIKTNHDDTPFRIACKYHPEAVKYLEDYAKRHNIIIEN